MTPGLRPSAARHRRRALRPRWGAVAAVLAVAVVAGCSPHRELYPQIESLAARGQYGQAAQLVERNKAEYGERNAVLYHLDRGTMYHYAGEYEKSNQAFEAAERRMDALYTQSVSGNVAAFLSNDNTLPYRGEDFEQVTVNIYRALNYVKLRDIDAALVEARKVDNKLNYFNDQYEQDKKNRYQEDAFARMLMGIFFEMSGTRTDLNDAFIANRLAVGIYEKDFQPVYRASVPELLKRNLLTTADFMGSQEFQEALARFPGVESIGLGEKERKGQLYFVHFCGRSPEKVEDSIDAVMPDGNLFRIAFPRYAERSYLIDGSRVRVDGRRRQRLEVGSPLGAIAVKNLQDRKTRIMAKAIARATTKYMATRAAQNVSDDEGVKLLAFLAGNVYAAASERADLRSWQTLPDKILIGRVLVEPGAHQVAVEFTSGAGTVSTVNLGTMEVGAGRTRFVILHSVR